MISSRTQTRIALSFFLLTALLGVALRLFPVIDIPANYRYLLHTHSHIALLGWVYLAITTLFYKLFLGDQNLDRKYRHIFWFTWATIVGMLLTFPFWGYAPLSIFYSTMFLFASYWFTWFFFKHVPDSLKKKHSYQLIGAALWFMVISSLGPWALGIIINVSGPESIWYRLAIYFYLHFQYNGWMSLALLGLLFHFLDRHQISISGTEFRHILWLILTGILLSFFLSTLWTKPATLIYLLGGLGGLLQVLGYAKLIMLFAAVKHRLLKVFSDFQRDLLWLVAGLLIIKILLQLLTALPYFAELAATVPDFTIGYLHLTLLGMVSLALFLFLEYWKLLVIPKTAFYFYLFGFVFTEGLIFYKGMVLWQQWPLFSGYFQVLAASSFLIPIGLLMILVKTS